AERFLIKSDSTSAFRALRAHYNDIYGIGLILNSGNDQGESEKGQASTNKSVLAQSRRESRKRNEQGSALIDSRPPQAAKHHQIATGHPIEAESMFAELRHTVSRSPAGRPTLEPSGSSMRERFGYRWVLA